MSDYPHTCPNCGSAAYVGLNDIECTGKRCKHYIPGSGVNNPDAGMLYRDFCASCHLVAEFDREDTGKCYVADCPQCGCMNSWSYGEAGPDDDDPFEDEDTQPQGLLFGGLLGGPLDADVD